MKQHKDGMNMRHVKPSMAERFATVSRPIVHRAHEGKSRVAAILNPHVVASRTLRRTPNEWS